MARPFSHPRRIASSSVSSLDRVPGHVAASHRFGLAVPGLFLRPSKVRQGTRFELRLLLPSDESALIDDIVLTSPDEQDIPPGHFWPTRLESWLLSYGVSQRIPNALARIDRRAAAERVNVALRRAGVLYLVGFPR